MKNSQRRTVRALLVITAVLTTLVMALPAEAGTLIIKPRQLKKVGNLQPDARGPFFVASSGNDTVQFYYPLKMPRGTVLKNLRYQHSGVDGPQTGVGIVRTKADSSKPYHLIMNANSTEETAAAFSPVWVDADVFAGLKARTIRKGWQYYVLAASTDYLSLIWKIKVVYE